MLGTLMPHFTHIGLRILAGIAGALLLYVAFFLYEDEEARIQNRVEQIWRRIDALQSAAMSKEVAFLQGVTQTTSAIFDRLLGHKLLSMQSIAVSMAFSLASLLFFWSYVSHFPASETTTIIIFALVLFFLGTLPAFALRLFQPGIKHTFYHFGLILLVVCVPWVNALLVNLFSTTTTVGQEDNPLVLLIVVIGVFIDIFFIVFFRWVLKAITNLSQFWLIVVYLAAVSTVTAILVGPVLLLFPSRFSVGLRGHFVWVGNPWSSVRYYVFLACSVFTTNLVDVLCLLLLLVIMLLLLAHRLIWPLIKRPIYAANRKGLIKNTKLLGALGTMLLMYAFPNNPVVKWVTHFLPNLKGG